MLTTEFKNFIKDYLKNNPSEDAVDAFIAKFDDFDQSTEQVFFDALENCDPRCLLVRLFANYYYQVNNGGHFQYFDNGYASNGGGCFSHKDGSIGNHEEFIKLVRKYFPKNEVSIKFLSLLEDFENHVIPETCSNCDGTGYTEYEDECSYCNGTGEDSEGGTCDMCGGTGTVTGEDECEYCHGSGEDEDNFTYDPDEDKNDDKFYEMEKDVLALLNNLCLEWVNSDGDGIKDDFSNDKSTKPEKTIRVKLIGRDGNAFAIIATCTEAMRSAGKSREEIEAFQKEATAADYDNLLVTCMKYFEVY